MFFFFRHFISWLIKLGFRFQTRSTFDKKQSDKHILFFFFLDEWFDYEQYCTILQYQPEWSPN